MPETHGRALNTPSDHRLKKRRDFLRIQRFGARASARSLVLTATKTTENKTWHVGFTVPRQVGKAHCRNLIKRRLRHLVQLHTDCLMQKDTVILARPAAAALSFADLEKDFICATTQLLAKLVNASQQRGRR